MKSAQGSGFPGPPGTRAGAGPGPPGTRAGAGRALGVPHSPQPTAHSQGVAPRIGIFGGTFNPIHVGHLLLAETARETLSLDRIVFIPNHQPPHKASTHVLPGAQRLALVQLAIRDHPTFVASDIELQREGPSYSIETVKALRGQLPKAALFLLMGQDMLAVRWVAWDELKRLCTMVVARRPGPPPRRSLPAGRGPPRLSCPAGRGIRWLEMPQVEIASSDIRRRIAAGRSIRYLVPSAVARYIREHQLYQPGGKG